MVASPRPDIAQAKGEEAPQLSRWEHLARLAIGDYLKDCLGGNRKAFFSSFAPYSTNWTVRSDVTWSGENPLEQAVQIARYYEATPEHPPQILIRSTGYAPVPSSLGNFDFGSRVGWTNTVAMIKTAKVSLEIACGAVGDDNKTGLLLHFVETALGPDSRYLINGLLVPSDPSRRNWCVHLPLTWSVSGATNTPIGEDRKNSLWNATLTMEVEVEVGEWAQYDTKLDIAYLASQMVTISTPSTMRVGTYAPLYVTSERPGDALWRSSDFRLAIIAVGEQLYAKRVGTVAVSLISAIRENLDPYASATVSIVP